MKKIVVGFVFLCITLVFLTFASAGNISDLSVAVVKSKIERSTINYMAKHNIKAQIKEMTIVTKNHADTQMGRIWSLLITADMLLNDQFRYKAVYYVCACNNGNVYNCDWTYTYIDDEEQMTKYKTALEQYKKNVHKNVIATKITKNAIILK